MISQCFKFQLLDYNYTDTNNICKVMFIIACIYDYTYVYLQMFIELNMRYMKNKMLKVHESIYKTGVHTVPYSPDSL